MQYARDEYEYWDEHEEDGEEQEEEEGNEDGYEETQQPTQEQLDYLSLRQKLKESIRKQMKKDLGTANCGSRDKTNAFRKDNYGSFFGPSQPVIAQRVIQESKSLLENPDLAARISKPNHKINKGSGSAPVRLKSQANYQPSVKNGMKRKVEMLKNTRDYSFLLSEDAEVPTSSKTPPSRTVSAPKSDARSTELPSRSKPVVKDHRREVSNSHDGRKPVLASSQSKPKVGLEKLTHTGKSSMESRRQLGSNNGSGPGRPLGPKSVPTKSSLPASGKMSQPVAKNSISGVHKATSSPVQSAVRRPTPSNVPSGAYRPTQSNAQSGAYRPTPSHVQPSLLKRSSVQKDYRETSKPKVMSKQALPSSRVQMKRSPPKPPARAPQRDERLKAKPKRQPFDDASDDDKAINMIRQMFHYNPSKFRDDDDDSDMEANFDDIMREEKRSEIIARKEDEEQLRLIEEEERREKLRAKKRKLSHQ